MTPRLMTRFQWLAVVTVLCASTVGYAARISVQPRGEYQRASFTFEQPTRLTVDQKGTSLTLRFTAPVKQTPEAIAAALGNYVQRANVSADGKTVTLTLTKPMRTRHFVSGSMVGIDFIGKPPAKPATPPAAVEDPILSTKKPETVKKPEPAATLKAAPAEDPILTTKKPTPPPAPVVEQVEEKPVVPAPAPNRTLPEPKPASEPKPAPSPATPEPQPKTPPPAPSPAPPAGSSAFAVTVRTANNQSILNFPFKERTAAAVFERGNDVWLIFSRNVPIKPELLRSVLPKTVTDLTLYNAGENTVLRLRTTGKLHAAADNRKDSYEWDITLSPNTTPPGKRIAITTDTQGNKSRLLAAAYDVSAPLKFYDPIVGDLILAIPSYENHHGVPEARHFPELTVLSTPQGVVVTSNRDDLSTSISRLGVAIENAAGLSLSQNLSVMDAESKPVLGLNSGVLLPYKEWFVATKDFYDTLHARQQALRNATKDSRPETLYALATLYLGKGMGSEALGYLDLLAANEPEFYKANKLALLTAAAHTINNHLDAANAALAVPELQNVQEAELWREYLALFTNRSNGLEQLQRAAGEAPAAVPAISLADDTEDEGTTLQDAPVPVKPVMRFLKYNRNFIRFYPPPIRRMLATAAADAYIANGLEEKALAVFDTLNRDHILDLVQPQAEYAVALVGLKNKKEDQAIAILSRLANQLDDPKVRARARVTDALRQYNAGEKNVEETAEALESARMGWRGDQVESDILKRLANFYLEHKKYDEALRTLKTLTDEFPADPDFLSTSAQMSELFENLYLNGQADEMPPLKSLSLFYEFRDLTPIGDKGDLIIQRLADRLAAFDLINRASQLLENQINYRLSGEARSRVGARLALLYLFNRQPQEALTTLENTNYGQNAPELQRQRMQLAAQALSALGRPNDALNMIYNDRSDAALLLKLDILWAAQDWPNVIATGEEILGKRTDLTAALTPTETAVLLKLALGYSFQRDYNQLRYLRDYYSALIPESGYKQIFDFITNDTTPLDREDATMLTQQINRTESFLSTFKQKIAAGKLSEAVK